MGCCDNDEFDMMMWVTGRMTICNMSQCTLQVQVCTQVFDIAPNKKQTISLNTSRATMTIIHDSPIGPLGLFENVLVKKGCKYIITHAQIFAAHKCRLGYLGN